MKKLVFICIFIIYVLFFSLKVNAISDDSISAESYVLIEANSGEIIAANNELQQRPMASTTKIMTTLLLIESGNLEDEFVVDNNAIKVEGSSMGLCENDVVTKLSLAYGMMLPSGNDAANQTAVLLSGNISDFAYLMNHRAQKIGMKNTNFVTPSGLHDDNHYSTAYDMALLTREALKNDLFKKICSTKKAQTVFGNPPYERWLVNTNKLLHMYDYCTGVKTGFTDEAGRCLVSSAEKDGITLICVTLNAPNDWNDHIKLYNYGFSVTTLNKIDYDFSKLSVNIVGGEKDTLSVIPDNAVVYTEINGIKPDITSKVILEKFIYAPVNKGDIVGKINFYSNGKQICTANLITNDNCCINIVQYEPNILEKIIARIKRIM